MHDRLYRIAYLHAKLLVLRIYLNQNQWLGKFDERIIRSRELLLDDSNYQVYKKEFNRLLTCTCGLSYCGGDTTIEVQLGIKTPCTR